MRDEQPKQPVTISRDNLYAQVWEKPMSRLANEYGISGNGLAKICDRLGVPCPPRGYWARKAAGRTVRQTPLPAARPGKPAQATITPSQPAPPPARLSPELEEALVAARRHTAGLTRARPPAAPPPNRCRLDQGTPDQARGRKTLAPRRSVAGRFHGHRSAPAPHPERALLRARAARLPGESRRPRPHLARDRWRAGLLHAQGEIPPGAPAADRGGEAAGLQPQKALEIRDAGNRPFAACRRDRSRSRASPFLDRRPRPTARTAVPGHRRSIHSRGADPAGAAPPIPGGRTRL